MREMIARFAGSCRGCGRAIKAGERIAHAGRGRSYHAGCAPAVAAAPADRALARYVAEGLGEEYVDDDADYRRQRRWDNSQYAQGLADGRRFSEDRKVYGEALAERWAMEEELARWNRGEDY
jgi:hypothetical protein